MSGLALAAALIALAVVGWLPWAPVRARRLAARRANEHEVRDAVDDAVVLDLVRATLMSGHDVVTAIDAVGHALPPAQGARFVRAARALRLGAPWETAWKEPCQVTAALSPAWSDGVDPEPLLRHAAISIRENRQARAREAAARLGVRLVLPLGLCLLPAFVLLGLVPLLLSAGMQLWP